MAIFSYALVITGSHWNGLGDAYIVRRLFSCNEEMGFQFQTHSQCNLETGIDPMRAKRVQEGKETSVLHSYSHGEEEQSRRAKERTKVREISLVACLK